MAKNRGASRAGGEVGGIIGRGVRPFLRGSKHRGSRRNGLGGTSRKSPLNPREIQNKWGIRRKDQKKFQSYAEKRNLQIDVRPVNPKSLPHLRNNQALPKPEHVKAKTVNSYDVMLNPKLKGNEGKVGFFDPGPRPSRPPGMSDQDWKGLKSRYDQRSKEYSDYQDSMRTYGDQGKVRIDDNGIVSGQDRNGQWKPYAGDNDLYDIRHHPSRERLAPEEYDRTVQEMQDRNMGVNHGAHSYWAPTDTKGQDIRATIEQNHQPGGEPLVRFTPGESPSLVDGRGARVWPRF
jgi:hypothetical protein